MVNGKDYYLSLKGNLEKLRVYKAKARRRLISYRSGPKSKIFKKNQAKACKRRRLKIKFNERLDETDEIEAPIEANESVFQELFPNDAIDSLDAIDSADETDDSLDEVPADFKLRSGKLLFDPTREIGRKVDLSLFQKFADYKLLFEFVTSNWNRTFVFKRDARDPNHVSLIFIFFILIFYL